MINLEKIIKKGLITDNWFVDGTGKDAVNIVIALRDEDALAYKENGKTNWLLGEYQAPIKLKQWEFDLLDYFTTPGYTFDKSYLNDLKTEKGHFAGICNTTMLIDDILKNCVIVDDDYTDFDECK